MMEGNGAAVGHQGPDPEGRVVECMFAIADSGATRRGAAKSARPPPIRSRNLGKTSRRSASTPAVGMRPSGLGSGAPSSTFLGLSRTVGHHARWQDTPAAEEVRGIVCRPGHKDIVRLPTGMATAAGGLEHPDNLLVEMARMQADSASTHVGEQLRDFQGQPPEFKGIVAGAMEMPQVRLIFCAAVPSPAARIGGSRATRTSGAQRHQILDLGQRISQKTRGRSRRRDGRALTIFAF
jgi:hypothetical protein